MWHLFIGLILHACSWMIKMVNTSCVRSLSPSYENLEAYGCMALFMYFSINSVLSWHHWFSKSHLYGKCFLNWSLMIEECHSFIFVSLLPSNPLKQCSYFVPQLWVNICCMCLIPWIRNEVMFSLLQVISKLTDGKATHIPYRDSKLTRLLQSSLSGQGRVSVSWSLHAMTLDINIMMLFHNCFFCS